MLDSHKEEYHVIKKNIMLYESKEIPII